MSKLKNKYIQHTQASRLSGLASPIIGLTGGIATGKSTVSDYLKAQGHPVICADQMVKRLYSREETKAFIAQNFPEAYGAQGIDFKKLREVFFHQEKAQAMIEGFLYPRLALEVKAEFEDLGSPSYIFYDVPLLFEKNMASGVDLRLLVYAPYELQLKRLLERDKISTELAQEILSKQWPIDQKLKLSDFVIKNEGAREELPTEIEKILKEIFV